MAFATVVRILGQHGVPDLVVFKAILCLSGELIFQYGLYLWTVPLKDWP